MEGGETGVRGWYKSMLKSMEVQVRFKTVQTERSLCSIERGGYWWKEEGGASNPHTAPLHIFDRVARGGAKTRSPLNINRESLFSRDTPTQTEHEKNPQKTN